MKSIITHIRNREIGKGDERKILQFYINTKIRNENEDGIDTLDKRNFFKGQDLSGLKFYRKNLTGYNFSNCNMERVDFEGSILNYANMSNANLTKADLSNTELYETNFDNSLVKGMNIGGSYYLYSIGNQIGRTKGSPEFSQLRYTPEPPRGYIKPVISPRSPRSLSSTSSPRSPLSPMSIVSSPRSTNSSPRNSLWYSVKRKSAKSRSIKKKSIKRKSAKKKSKKVLRKSRKNKNIK